MNAPALAGGVVLVVTGVAYSFVSYFSKLRCDHLNACPGFPSPAYPLLVLMLPGLVLVSASFLYHRR